MGGSSTKIAFEVCVVTGDYRGDELGPNVNMVMFDSDGVASPIISLESMFQSEPDSSQAKFTIDLQSWSRLKVFGKLHHMEFWRTGHETIDLDWYLDRVIVRDRRFGMTAEWKYFFFPVHQWITPEHQYVVHNCEAHLPNQEPIPSLRDAEIARRMQSFVYVQRAKGLPVELQSIPPTELFSSDARWDIEELVLDVIEKSGLAVEYTNEEPWDSLDTLGNIYKQYNITEPVGLQFWMMNDICFGAQRVRGCNPFTIRLCRELPESLTAASDWIKPHLEGWSLRHVLAANRLYMLDYRIMHGLDCKRGRFMCAPIAIFFYTEKRQLKPIAIQLNQGLSEDDVVFLPTDSNQVWLQAKMWVNLADACHHIVAGRLLTHLLLESIYVSMRRNLAQSHPVYQLLAPHFRSILPVTGKLKEWAFGNGWISRNIQLSRKGIKQLLKRAFRQWRFDIQANIYRDMESRGVYNSDHLGNYPFRDDALIIHRIMEDFVTKYIRLFYPRGAQDLLDDSELQSWRHEIASPMAEGGLGVAGVPGSVYRPRGLYDNGVPVGSKRLSLEEVFGLVTVDETVKFIVGLLYLSVIVAGSALRLPMYDEYGFPAHYPLSLLGPPPTEPGPPAGSMLSGLSAANSLASISLDQVVSSLPNRQMTVEIILYTRLASRVQQSVLGNFESDYIFGTEAVKLLDEFRTKLAESVSLINANNLSRDMHHQYVALDPSVMPNYPGI